MNTTTPNYHVLIASFIGWTAEKPSRIKIRSPRFEQTVIIPFDTDNGIDTCEIAEHWLQIQGFKVIGHSEGKDCYYIITDTFEPLKKPRK